MKQHNRIAQNAARVARQGAIMMNSAIAAMTRAAVKSNPEKQLRCWTAERTVEANRVLAGRAGK
jgi:hypothetical protein